MQSFRMSAVTRRRPPRGDADLNRDLIRLGRLRVYGNVVRDGVSNINNGAPQGRIRWSTLVDNGKRFAFGLEFENREMERHQPCLYRYLKELEAMFYPI